MNSRTTTPRYVFVTHGDGYMKRVRQRALLSFLSSTISIVSSIVAVFFTTGTSDPAWGMLFVVANLGLILAIVHMKVLRRIGW